MSKRDKAKVAREAARKWLAENGGDRQKLAEKAGIGQPEANDFVDKRTDDIHLASAIAQVTGVHLPEIDVHDFRASGYLPEALVNYLALLGWSPKNDSERIDAARLAELFDIGGIGKSSARFDRVKLLAVDADAIRGLTCPEFQARLRDYFSEFYPEYLQRLGSQFERFADGYKERARTLAEPTESGWFFFADDDSLRYDPAAVKKTLLANDGAGLRVLREILPQLLSVEPWSVEALEQKLGDIMQSMGVALGKIGQPLRISLSGGTVTPPLHDTLVILGKKRVIKRIERCLEQLS